VHHVSCIVDHTMCKSPLDKCGFFVIIYLNIHIYMNIRESTNNWYRQLFLDNISSRDGSELRILNDYARIGST
jgi:hypothetical protein